MNLSVAKSKFSVIRQWSWANDFREFRTINLGFSWKATAPADMHCASFPCPPQGEREICGFPAAFLLVHEALSHRGVHVQSDCGNGLLWLKTIFLDSCDSLRTLFCRFQSNTYISVCAHRNLYVFTQDNLKSKAQNLLAFRIRTKSLWHSKRGMLQIRKRISMAYQTMNWSIDYEFIQQTSKLFLDAKIWWSYGLGSKTRKCPESLFLDTDLLLKVQVFTNSYGNWGINIFTCKQTQLKSFRQHTFPISLQHNNNRQPTKVRTTGNRCCIFFSFWRVDKRQLEGKVRQPHLASFRISQTTSSSDLSPFVDLRTSHQSVASAISCTSNYIADLCGITQTRSDTGKLICLCWLKVSFDLKVFVQIFTTSAKEFNRNISWYLCKLPRRMEESCQFCKLPRRMEEICQFSPQFCETYNFSNKFHNFSSTISNVTMFKCCGKT